MAEADITGYRYGDAALGHAHDYLLPSVFRTLDALHLPAGGRRLFDLGCGNGGVARTLTELLREAGFVDIHFERVGRVPAFAKSMIAVARKP